MKKFFLSTLFLMTSLLVTGAFAQQATLNWNAPTENADGTELTDLAGFKVYKRHAQNDTAYEVLQTIYNQSQTSYEASGLETGLTCFYVTAFDTSGNESTSEPANPDDMQESNAHCKVLEAPPGPVCGDGVIEAPEQCDGSNVAGQSCQDHGFFGGDLACDPTNCTFDTSACHNPQCNDGVAEGNEECDGSDLQGQSCESQGFDGGNLSCNSNCSFDTGQCTTDSPDCGNGVINGTEECDGTELNGASCASEGFLDGTLDCYDHNCSFDTRRCNVAVCGNGEVEGNEECDGGDLGGESCVSLEHYGGYLDCYANCSFDESECALSQGIGGQTSGQVTVSSGGCRTTSAANGIMLSVLLLFFLVVTGRKRSPT